MQAGSSDAANIEAADVKRMRLDNDVTMGQIDNKTFELLAEGGVWSSYGFFELETMEFSEDRGRLQVPPSSVMQSTIIVKYSFNSLTVP